MAQGSQPFLGRRSFVRVDTHVCPALVSRLPGALQVTTSGGGSQGQHEPIRVTSNAASAAFEWFLPATSDSFLLAVLDACGLIASGGVRVRDAASAVQTDVSAWRVGRRMDLTDAVGSLSLSTEAGRLVRATVSFVGDWGGLAQDVTPALPALPSLAKFCGTNTVRLWRWDGTEVPVVVQSVRVEFGMRPKLRQPAGDILDGAAYLVDEEAATIQLRIEYPRLMWEDMEQDAAAGRPVRVRVDFGPLKVDTAPGAQSAYIVSAPVLSDSGGIVVVDLAVAVEDSPRNRMEITTV